MQNKNDLKFSWNFKFKQNLNKSSSSNNIKYNLISKRKESSHMRILKHIQYIQEKEHNNIKKDKLVNINNKTNSKRIEKNKNIEIAESTKEKLNLKINKNQYDKFDEKNVKDNNNNDSWSNAAQFNMDIIIDDSDEDKYKFYNHNEGDKNDSNNNKKHKPEFNIKRYKLNYKYKSTINKWKDDKRNKNFLSENNSFQKINDQHLISTDISLDVNHNKNKRINQFNNLDSLYFQPGDINKSKKMNTIINNKELYSKKRINK